MAVLSRLTVADVDTADPRKLAEMLRRECERANRGVYCKDETGKCNDCELKCPFNEIHVFAAALLKAVDLAEQPVVDCGDDCQRCWHADTKIESERCHRADNLRDIARVWLAAGGELSEEG